MNQQQTKKCGFCSDFCGSCQGYGWKTCLNKDKAQKLYLSGQVTENSNLQRKSWTTPWPWDLHYTVPKKNICNSLSN